VTLIDQRILIPTPVQAVWTVVADHTLLPKWRAECKSVSVLTMRSDGRGVRRRITPLRGKDIIEETIAWYEGLGYEYQVIEGTHFKSFSARIRLQATPDGTIVQWTIAFETRGFLGKLLGNRRRKRQLERLTAENLRQLRRYIESLGVSVDDQYRQRTGIRPAPDTNSRLEYGAKLFAEEQAQIESPDPTQPSRPTSAKPPGRIPEPPLKAEDTPNIPAVAPPSFIAEALLTTPIPARPAEPLKEPPRAEGDTRPNIAVTPPAPATATTPAVAASDQLKAALQTGTPKANETAKPLAAQTSPVEANQKPPAAAPAAGQPRRAASEEVEKDLQPAAHLPSPTDKRDTGEMSIWDVFGIPRPGVATAAPAPPATLPETEVKPAAEPPAVKAAAAEGAAIPPAPEGKPDKSKMSPLDEWLAANEPPLPASASGTIKTITRAPQPPRSGLRRQQRQQRAKVRPPMQPPKT
jgi:uncharacterized membrane protein